MNVVLGMMGYRLYIQGYIAASLILAGHMASSTDSGFHIALRASENILHAAKMERGTTSSWEKRKRFPCSLVHA